MFVALAFIVHPVLIGVLAQQWRKRTGVLWAVIALAVDLLLGLFTDSATSGRPHPGISQGAQEFAFIFMVFGLSTIVLAITLATLPKRAAPHDVSLEDEKTCPMCAEKVRAAALVCKHCGHKFEGSAPAP